ncbi:MAG: maleylpyruvate isomerase family mycothiol-dependent enzyme [Candidatus Dormiibacterota bacterium]
MPIDLWTLIHPERQALLEDVAALSNEQWNTQSLCADWTVRDTLAHLTSGAKMTPGRYIGGWVGAGFRFKAMNEKGIRAQRGSTAADTVAAFKSQLTATAHPPGPLQAMVAELVLHGEDIRRPLGIKHRYLPEALVVVGNFVTGGIGFLGGKRRSTGLKLTASDTEWTHGDGSEVSGPLASILIALTGREAGLADLSGDGVATLTQRV